MSKKKSKQVKFIDVGLKFHSFSNGYVVSHNGHVITATIYPKAGLE